MLALILNEHLGGFLETVNATRYLADRHVCGCFRFTLVVLASAYVEERGREREPCSKEKVGSRGEFRIIPPDQSVSSPQLTHLDPTLESKYCSRPTVSKTRGHVFANERVSFPRLRPLSSKRSAIGLTRFAKIERVMLFYLPIYNGFATPCILSPCNFFYLVDEEVGGKMILRVSCPRLICLGD